MTKENATRRDVYAEITGQLIAAIEANPGHPSLPWRRAGGPLHIPHNILTGKTYNGINILSLWVAAQRRAYSTPIWGTYRQWAESGAQVRKGEKSSLVIFYREYEIDADPADDTDTGKRRVGRASHVFNAAQVDGFTLPTPPEDLGAIDRIAQVDRFVSATKAVVRHGGDSAYYAADLDHIQMPDEGLFSGTDSMSRSEGYYATLVHELVHWSGAKSRLARDMGKRFGDATYAAEELVAEIGAAFLCADLAITQDTRPDHAQYLAHWLKMLKNDSRAIFTAAARASEAATFLKRLGGAP